MLVEGSVMGWLVPPVADFSANYRNRVLRAFFSLAPGKQVLGGAGQRSCRDPLKMSVRPPSCRCACRLCTLFVGCPIQILNRFARDHGIPVRSRGTSTYMPAA